MQAHLYTRGAKSQKVDTKEPVVAIQYTVVCLYFELSSVELLYVEMNFYFSLWSFQVHTKVQVTDDSVIFCSGPVVTYM